MIRFSLYGRDVDLMLHVNPEIENKGMLIAFNPTDREITKTVKVPLYYTGIKGGVKIISGDGREMAERLPVGAFADLTLTVPAGGFGWYLIRQGK